MQKKQALILGITIAGVIALSVLFYFVKTAVMEKQYQQVLKTQTILRI